MSRLSNIFREIIKLENYDPQSKYRDLLEKVYLLSRPREFEKLNISDQDCDEILKTLETGSETTQKNQALLRDMPKLAPAKAKTRFI